VQQVNAEARSIVTSRTAKMTYHCANHTACASIVRTAGSLQSCIANKMTKHTAASTASAQQVYGTRIVLPRHQFSGRSLQPAFARRPSPEIAL
jgi:pyruvate/2-oxoglutarate/acetoin dehydrogenase E1 component